MTVTVSLEHFYYGQMMMAGKLQGEPRLLAASSGIRPEHINDAVTEALLTAPNEMPGAVALVRGKSVPFWWVQAQMNGGAQPSLHFVAMPVDVLRGLGGNLQALLALVEAALPTFDMTGDTLPPVQLPPAGIPSPAEQEDAMLDLLTATNDRFDVIEGLLAAINQNMPVVVLNAPPQLPERIALIEGLLALMPPPARYGVTFATHSTNRSRVDVQVQFADEMPIPTAGLLIYEWGASKFQGKKPDDEYARYIKSQLRLDMGLVIEQTRTLTPVAGWRLRRGDAMGAALGYAAYRLAIDNALLNHQPVEGKDVVKVLAEDPTLTEDLRILYIRHLLAFALALDEDENTDLLTDVARGQPDLEKTILEAMKTALADGRGDRVYRRVARWLGGTGGFRGMYWVELLQRAAVANAEILANNNDAEALNVFLQETRSAPNANDYNLIIARLIDIALPLAVQNKPSARPLAETVFALAATALPTERLARVMSAKPLLAQLPEGVSRLIQALTIGEHSASPPGLVAQVISDFGVGWRPLLYIRLAELIALAGRYDLLDGTTLNGLASAAATAWGTTYDDTLRWLVRQIGSDEQLPTLSNEGRTALLSILLTRRAYPELCGELARFGKLYSGEKQLQFGTMVHGLFVESDVPIDDVHDLLAMMADRGVRPLPLALAYFAVLQRHRWNPLLNSTAAALSRLVGENRILIESLQPEFVMELLRYHAERRETPAVIRLATLLPFAAGRRGGDGVAIMINMVQSLDWDPEVRAAALESVRRYVRRISDSGAEVAIARFAEKLGEPVRQRLEATLFLYRMMGGEPLGDYAYTLHSLAQFMYDTGLAYMDKGRVPTLTSVLSDLDSLGGGLSNEEKVVMANGILYYARLASALANSHRAVRAKENDEQIEQMLAGRGTAMTLIDVFRIMGGYFARGKRLTVRSDRVISSHPLSDRAAHLLLRELEQTNRLLQTALRAVGQGGKIALQADAVQSEIESLWSDISLHERRTLVRDLAIDLQRIPEMALIITERTDQRVLQDDNGQGRRLESMRHRPETALEFYRFMHGYFKARAR